MQQNELKALLSKTDEVAFQPVHVEVEISNPRNKRRQIYCPSGLIRGKVLEDGVKWVEKRVIAVCGDQDYAINRKNGVLVEIDPDDLPEDEGAIVGKNYHTKFNGKRNPKPYPHTVVVTRDGKKYIHIVTNRKAIYSSWGEYALEMAKRAKENEEREAREAMLRIPQAHLMGFTDEEFEKKYVNNNGKRSVYLGRDWIEVSYKKDANGKEIYEKDAYGYNRPIPEEEVGRIQITLDRAHEILNILTAAQKKKLGIPNA